MLKETFKRGQVEWAIWGVYTQQRAAAGDPPPAFHTRLKRLLEADRDPTNPPSRDEGYAFASTAGTGNDAVFLAYDGFALALALELLGSGFKPSEIIALLRRSRGPLERQFNAVVKVPRPQRMRAPAKAWPSLPSYFEAGEELADGRVFMVLPTVELDEVLPLYNPKMANKAAAFPDAKFCQGINELRSELGRMRSPRWSYRKAFVMEIAELAVGLCNLLPEAPLTKRGRKS